MKYKFNRNELFKIIWIAICVFWCGWFLVKVVDNSYQLWEKIFLGAGLVVISFYIVFREKEKDKKESLSDTVQHYKCHTKYIKGEHTDHSYEQYLSTASNDYMCNVFSEILTEGIIDALHQFETERNINSLYALHILKNEILDNWAEFENTPVKIPCFISGYDTLTVLPLNLDFFVRIDDRIYQPTDFDMCIRFNKTSAEGDPLNKHNEYAFANVFATLQKDEYGCLTLINCTSELADFETYRKEICIKKD